MNGWKKIKNGTLCGIITIPENFIRVDSSKNSTDNNIETKPSENNFLVIIITIGLFCIMAYYMIRWWKNADQRHVHQRLNNA